MLFIVLYGVETVPCWPCNKEIPIKICKITQFYLYFVYLYFSPSVPSTVDPVKKELQQAEQRATSFMIATYALIGVLLPAIIITIILMLYYCRSRRRGEYEDKQDSTVGKEIAFFRATVWMLVGTKW